MYDHKTMHAFYNTMGHRFIGEELYTGCFSCEPVGDKYCCTDWVLMSKQTFGTVLDRDITGTVIMDMPALETLKIPKTSAACCIFHGKPECMSENSRFHLRTSKPGAVRDKLNEHSLRYDPRTKNMHMAQVAGKGLCTFQAIHHGVCLSRTISAATFKWMKALYFYVEPQGNETQEQMRTHLLDKRKE